MLPFHLRLAELYHQQPWTLEQATEVQHCLQANARYCWDTMKLQQLSIVAAGTQDAEWLDELRVRTDTLRLTGRAPTI